MEVLKRLLYKEFRESWVVAATLFVAPAVVFTLVAYAPKSLFVEGMAIATGLSLPLMIVVWATAKEFSDEKKSTAALAHQPVNPWLAWLTSTVVTSIVTCLLSVWLFWWSTTTLGLSEQVLPFALWLTAAFLATTALSRAASPLIGCAAGFGTLVNAYVTTEAPPSGWALYLIGAALILTLLPVISRKKTAKTRGWFAAGFATASALAALAVLIAPMLSAKAFESDRWIVIDRNCLMRESEVGAPLGAVWLEATRDLRGVLAGVGDEHTRRLFPRSATPLAAREDDLYLIRPRWLFSRNADLVAWNIRLDTVRKLATLPIGQPPPFTKVFLTATTGLMGPVGYWSDVKASLSPDARHVLIRQPSRIGEGMDLLLVDLQSGRARMPVVNQVLNMNAISWSSQKVILSGVGGILYIDRQTTKVEMPKLPDRKEVL